MLPPRPNPTFLTSSGLGFLPRHHSCFPALLNHKAGSTIARGRFWDFGNGFASGIGIGNGNAGGLERNAYVRHASSSSSSTRWKSRQGKDAWAREAKVQGLKSRAAFKLLEVSYERTKPHGRILGIDIIPAQPPQGVSTIQGNFLSRRVQKSVKNFLLDPERGRPRRPLFTSPDDVEDIDDPTPLDIAASEPSYIDLERHMDDNEAGEIHPSRSAPAQSLSQSHEPSQEQEQESEKDTTKMVHVVLSDMCAPWVQTTGFWKRSLSDPYNRMMNTTGIKFSDHAGSMDLCNAALQFAFDTLRPGGHFVCKFYQGAEDKELELKLKKMFAVVHREKPESSRSESKEAYFVALRRNGYNDAASLGYVNDA
ncbi:hypothetical protein BGAL_0174g00160 [Botrytis galanthina]|uniref:rRNA methyltransferase 2, mitochondrial n=1 Tax=Botrytis galanthina TaxID=278940 RepID=A0A4S8R6M6_9HELO|nr:hypothetical protein BGAL_0174g00160 [Botrytis galanthina]